MIVHIKFQVHTTLRNLLNLLAVADMSEKKTPLDLWGWGVPRKPPSTHLKNETFQP